MAGKGSSRRADSQAAVRAEETTAHVTIDGIKQRFTTSKRLRIRPGRAPTWQIRREADSLVVEPPG
jgi:hypothetical protein